jgi:hypothetical protein
MGLNLSQELLEKLRRYTSTEETPEQLLSQLEKSELLSSDFPRRSCLTHEEVAGDPGALWRAKSVDSAPALTVAVARSAIEALGRAKYEPAVPLLITLWSNCPEQEVLRAAGAALLAIGTPEALAAVSMHLDEYDPDGRITQFAVRAMFRADPACAYDRLIGYFDPHRLGAPGGKSVPFQVIKTFGPIGKDDKGTQWVDPNSPQWFRADPRWLDLCVKLRRDSQLRDIISNVLDQADRSEPAAAVARAKAAGGKRSRVLRSAAVGDLVSRYRRGEHIEVWRELRRVKAIDGPLREEALAVAVETMRRVARCCDLAAERLSAEGWAALSGHLRSAPEPDLAKLLAAVEKASGSPVPPSLLAFWQVVGAVDFVWDYEQAQGAPTLGLEVDLTDMDPLAVDGVANPVALWLDRRSPGDLDTPSPLWLAPDYLHKANISGGDPYSIYLPFLGADPPLNGESHDLPFVDYLRLALRWGGFPGLEEHAGSAAVQSFVARMTPNFEPF